MCGCEKCLPFDAGILFQFLLYWLEQRREKRKERKKNILKKVHLNKLQAGFISSTGQTILVHNKCVANIQMHTKRMNKIKIKMKDYTLIFNLPSSLFVFLPLVSDKW